LNEIGWDGELKRAKQEDFNLPAKRPKFSVLDRFEIEKLLGIKIKRWDEATEEFLKLLDIESEG
jgi:dTDP-4-dehydrorhamnose reductase